MLFYLLLLMFCFSPTLAKDVQPFWEIYNPSKPMICYRSNSKVSSPNAIPDDTDLGLEFTKGFIKTMIPMALCITKRTGYKLFTSNDNADLMQVNSENTAWSGGVWLADIISLGWEPSLKTAAHAAGSTIALFCLLAAKT